MPKNARHACGLVGRFVPIALNMTSRSIAANATRATNDRENG